MSTEPTAEQIDMLDAAHVHESLRNIVAFGRRGGYDNDEIADNLGKYVRDLLAAAVTAERERIVRWVLTRRDEAGLELSDRTTNPAWVVLDDVAIGISEVSR